MINRPPSNLKPLTSEESRIVARNVMLALKRIPEHRHTKKTSAVDCTYCVIQGHLIEAFLAFQRFGE